MERDDLQALFSAVEAGVQHEVGWTKQDVFYFLLPVANNHVDARIALILQIEFYGFELNKP